MYGFTNKYVSNCLTQRCMISSVQFSLLIAACSLSVADLHRTDTVLLHLACTDDACVLSILCCKLFLYNFIMFLIYCISESYCILRIRVSCVLLINILQL